MNKMYALIIRYTGDDGCMPEVPYVRYFANMEAAKMAMANYAAFYDDWKTESADKYVRETGWTGHELATLELCKADWRDGELVPLTTTSFEEQFREQLLY